MGGMIAGIYLKRKLLAYLLGNFSAIRSLGFGSFARCCGGQGSGSVPSVCIRLKGGLADSAQLPGLAQRRLALTHAERVCQ